MVNFYPLKQILVCNMSNRVSRRYSFNDSKQNFIKHKATLITNTSKKGMSGIRHLGSASNSQCC